MFTSTNNFSSSFRRLTAEAPRSNAVDQSARSDLSYIKVVPESVPNGFSYALQVGNNVFHRVQFDKQGFTRIYNAIKPVFVRNNLQPPRFPSMSTGSIEKFLDRVLNFPGDDGTLLLDDSLKSSLGVMDGTAGWILWRAAALGRRERDAMLQRSRSRTSVSITTAARRAAERRKSSKDKHQRKDSAILRMTSEHEGWLEKAPTREFSKSKPEKGWQQRFFRLNDGQLTYHKNIKDLAKGVIDLNAKGTSIRLTLAATQEDSRIEIQYLQGQRTRVLVARASTRGEFIGWTNAFRKCGVPMEQASTLDDTQMQENSSAKPVSIVQGWLRKAPTRPANKAIKKVRGWQRRYFRLKDGQLTYHKNIKDSAKGVIDLNAKGSFVKIMRSSDSNLKLFFEINFTQESEQKVLLAQAENEFDFQMWSAAFRVSNRIFNLKSSSTDTESELSEDELADILAQQNKSKSEAVAASAFAPEPVQPAVNGRLAILAATASAPASNFMSPIAVAEDDGGIAGNAQKQRQKEQQIKDSSENDKANQPPASEDELWVVADYDLEPDDDDELECPAGALIKVLDRPPGTIPAAKEPYEWWKGTYGGKYGIFPENFVSLATKAQIAQMKQSKTASAESVFSHEDGKYRNDTAHSHPESNSDEQAQDSDDGMTTEEKEERQRKIMRGHVINEILKTETDYCNSLKVFDTEYKAVLEEMERRSNAIMTRQEMKLLFNEVPLILGISRKLLEELSLAISGESQRYSGPDKVVRIGRVFRDFAPSFLMYTRYLSNADESMACIQEILEDPKRASRYRRFVASKSESLDSLLIKPVQRIPRYELLLKELKKHTEKTHPDYEDLVTAIDLVHKSATRNNEMLRELEAARMYLEEMQNFTDLLPPERRKLTMKRRLVDAYCMGVSVSYDPKKTLKELKRDKRWTQKHLREVLVLTDMLAIRVPGQGQKPSLAKGSNRSTRLLSFRKDPKTARRMTRRVSGARMKLEFIEFPCFVVPVEADCNHPVFVVRSRHGIKWLLVASSEEEKKKICRLIEKSMSEWTESLQNALQAPSEDVRLDKTEKTFATVRSPYIQVGIRSRPRIKNPQQIKVCDLRNKTKVRTLCICDSDPPGQAKFVRIANPELSEGQLKLAVADQDTHNELAKSKSSRRTSVFRGFKRQPSGRNFRASVNVGALQLPTGREPGPLQQSTGKALTWTVGYIRHDYLCNFTGPALPKENGHLESLSFGSDVIQSLIEE